MELLDPEAGFVVPEGAGGGGLGGGLFVHAVDLFPQHPDGPLPVTHHQAGRFARGRGPAARLEQVLEHLEVEPLLAAEVVRQQGQWPRGPFGDHPHARPVEAVIRETDQGCLEQRGAGIRRLDVHADARVSTAGADALGIERWQA